MQDRLRRQDYVAEYGIAALVNATVTGSALKALGFFAYLKNIWGLFIAMAIAAFYKLKSFFKGNKNKVF